MQKEGKAAEGRARQARQMQFIARIPVQPSGADDVRATNSGKPLQYSAEQRTKNNAGKLRSRRNAVRHGLVAETVIDVLEDADDYRRFEAAVLADYDPRSTLEHKLVVRHASLLWRLRRATM